jgi:hypothetical protein
MIEVSVVEFEKDFDKYMDRIEAGERFIIRQPDGRGVVAVPATDLEQHVGEVGESDWYDTYSNHDDAC